MEADEFVSTGSVRSDWLGLGLDYGTVRLIPARTEWAEIAEFLAAAIRDALGERTVRVEHVGSTAVPGLAAKPIIDIAVGVGSQVATDAVAESLEGLGYEFRGDAGDSGGLVFVLSARPQHRVAHVHVVEHGGSQWHRYVAFEISCSSMIRLVRSTSGRRATWPRGSLTTASPTRPPRRR